MTKMLMKKGLLSLIACLVLMSTAALAQTKISGKVTDKDTKSPLIGTNIVVKGKVIGTTTDLNGNFELRVNSEPPFTLEVSMIGFERQEVQITEKEVSGLNIVLTEQILLGQEVVVSASRVEESILRSPVTIEKMDILAIQQTPADNYYKAIANLKGVDVTTSSINFQIVNARGFNSTGNTRFVQMTDGMDTQAPALNFPIGNLNGPSELDVESLEFLPGTSSALYGPNAFNGVLLVNSKSPFEYQGLSAFYKAGVNHIGANPELGEPDRPQPMHEASIRYAKAFNNKFAFKVNASYMQALDWHGTNYADDRNANLTPDGFTFNPAFDGIHTMGDEASTNIGLLGFAFGNALQTQGTPADNAQNQQLRALFNSIVGPVAGADASEFLNFVPSHVVARTPFEEHQLIDYNARNLKLNTSLHYRINDNVEAIYQWNFGGGTSIYTGAQRYSLSNFLIQQHKFELKGDNFFVRAYGTFENSGGSYITEFLGLKVNESFATNNTWFATYTANYLRYLAGNAGGTGYTPEQLAAIQQNDPTRFTQYSMNAHNFARGRADLLRPEPGSPEFEDAKRRGLESGVVPEGPGFDDQSKMYHAEAQYNFKNEVKFMDLVAGASYRLFSLSSNGTIFPDTAGNPITIAEVGAYVQGSKSLMEDRLKLSGSLRFDKNENFQGQFSPRLAAVYTVDKTHNFRVAAQTGFRNPTTQGQHINLNIISSRLLGGLPQYWEQYNIGSPLTYTLESVNEMNTQFYSTGEFNTNLLVNLTERNFVRPERIQALEFGYKSLINQKLMIDFVYYYNFYQDFITQIRVRNGANFTTENAPSPELVGQLNPATLLNGTADNTFQIYTNADRTITAQGAALGLTYLLPNNYNVGANYNWNVLNTGDITDDFVFAFNTPEHKFNVSFGNRKLTKNTGFNITGRWQSEFEWQSSFGDGLVPAVFNLDAQISYKLPFKTMLKIGGSNITNNRYILNFGGPTIGAIYYVSLTFDELMR